MAAPPNLCIQRDIHAQLLLTNSKWRPCLGPLDRNYRHQFFLYSLTLTTQQLHPQSLSSFQRNPFDCSDYLCCQTCCDSASPHSALPKPRLFLSLFPSLKQFSNPQGSDRKWLLSPLPLSLPPSYCSASSLRRNRPPIPTFSRMPLTQKDQPS